MKLPIFTQKENYVKYCNDMADMIEKNGLRLAQKQLMDAQNGIGINEFMSVNHISEEYRDIAWREQIEFLRGQVKFMERKVCKYRKLALE